MKKEHHDEIMVLLFVSGKECRMGKSYDFVSFDKEKMTILIKEDDRLLTASEVGKKWGCDPNYIRELYRRGLLKGIKFTVKTIKFRREEVEAFEKWAEDKNLADLDRITDIRTGCIVTERR